MQQCFGNMKACAPSCCSHHLAAGVGLAGLFVKHLAGHGQIAGFVDQAVKLFPPFKHALNGFVQDDLGLVQIPLDFGQLVCLSRILQVKSSFACAIALK